MDMWGQLAKEVVPLLIRLGIKSAFFLEIFVKRRSSLLVFMPTAGNFFVKLKSYYFAHRLKSVTFTKNEAIF